MDVPWPVYVILGPAIFFALFGVFVRPFRVEHVTGPFIQGAIVGVLASMGWWLAGIAAGLSGLLRYLVDGLVGFLFLASLVWLITAAILVKSARHGGS